MQTRRPVLALFFGAALIVLWSLTAARSGNASPAHEAAEPRATNSQPPGPGTSTQPAALGTLANVTLMRTNSLLSPALVSLGKTQTQYHTIQFTTGKAGVIAQVEIFYEGGQQRPEIAKSRLIAAWGIGAGAWSYQFGTQGVYAVEPPPANVPAGTVISIMLGDIYATSEGCYSLFLRTRDPAGAEIEAGMTASFSICNNEIGANGLEGVHQLAFGTCTIDPPRINDNDEVQLHMNGEGSGPTGYTVNPEDGSKNSALKCDLGVRGPVHVIAFPPANFDRGLVPKGSTAHCGPSSCHLDVRIRNVRRPDGSVDAGARAWAWIAFQPE